MEWLSVERKEKLLDALCTDHLILLDVETTGTSKDDEIIEFAARSFINIDENNLETEFTAMFKPEKAKLTEEITNITEITLEMLEEQSIDRKAFFTEFADAIRSKETVSRPLIIAHNAHFDINFLNREFKKHGIELEFDVLDTLTIFKDRKEYPNKLSDAIEYYGLSGKVKNSHRAMDDVNALIAVLEKMIDEKDDVAKYMNLIGFNPKYELVGEPLSYCDYLPQGFKYKYPLYKGTTWESCDISNFFIHEENADNKVLCTISKNGKYGLGYFAFPNGKCEFEYILPMEYDNIFSELCPECTLFNLVKNGKQGIVEIDYCEASPTIKFISNCEYDSVDIGNYCRLKNNNGVWIYNWRGELSPRYDSVLSVAPNLFQARVAEERILINKDFKILHKNNDWFWYASLSDNLIYSDYDDILYYDEKNTEVKSLNCKFVQEISIGSTFSLYPKKYMIVERNQKYGVINEKGEFVIPLEQDFLSTDLIFTMENESQGEVMKKVHIDDCYTEKDIDEEYVEF